MTSNDVRLRELCEAAGKQIKDALDVISEDAKPYKLFDPMKHEAARIVQEEIARTNHGITFKQGVYWLQSIDKSPPAPFSYLILTADHNEPGTILTANEKCIPKGLYLMFI